MNRPLKLILGAITLASLVAAVGVLAWRWREAGDLAAVFAGPKPFRAMMLLAMPFVMGGLLAFSIHAQGSRKSSRYEAGFIGLTLITHFGLLAAMQGWMTLVYLGGALPDREYATRLLAAFMGLGMSVRGNFFAKLPAPGEDEAGGWSRTARRSGLILFVTGLALAVCAILLPMPGVITALGGAFFLVLMVNQAQRKATAAFNS